MSAHKIGQSTWCQTFLGVLSSSNIYNFSLRFSYNYSLDILSETILSNFFQSCANLSCFLSMFCCYFLSRYDSAEAPNAPPADLPEDDFPALLDKKASSTFERVAESWFRFLIEYGNLYKKRANNIFNQDKRKVRRIHKVRKLISQPRFVVCQRVFWQIRINLHTS